MPYQLTYTARLLFRCLSLMNCWAYGKDRACHCSERNQFPIFVISYGEMEMRVIPGLPVRIISTPCLDNRQPGSILKIIIEYLQISLSGRWVSRHSVIETLLWLTVGDKLVLPKEDMVMDVASKENFRCTLRNETSLIRWYNSTGQELSTARLGEESGRFEMVHLLWRELSYLTVEHTSAKDKNTLNTTPFTLTTYLDLMNMDDYDSNKYAKIEDLGGEDNKEQLQFAGSSRTKSGA